ncbi:hypothetical protein SAMN06265365_101416 [Tistlia consotensis]|uniref:Uncharacterized protein n=1 Tax=Tistlia consotensis USBA 355 TaxID=560819 RepID=A0A1Y6B5W5_9PROT|nr:hypothetical protein [Tistlia consotensis]SME91579.1 hypothetical protein SAMN05428998_101414 [Tistlia consotensis USBA 355]SNR27448.1 hypothetical protein SAMN06265365_101416 [Tistlia consotensis]
MSCNSVLANYSVPTLGSQHIAAGATGSEVTLVSAQDNTAGVLVVCASMMALAEVGQGKVGCYLRSSNAFLVHALAWATSTARGSASVCGGPFIVPAGEEVVIGGGTTNCEYNVNWEVLS